MKNCAEYQIIAENGAFATGLLSSCHIRIRPRRPSNRSPLPGGKMPQADAADLLHRFLISAADQHPTCEGMSDAAVFARRKRIGRGHIRWLDYL
ncbi:hypothetical protein [Nitratireductor luteus]|uniref:hypothetical protein n=1 Tax=Nitratireductor luteus TaxID=2976980 RepID=UPI00223E91D8|nr:hypothetical protein [Nitratireductor luteus]